MGLETAGFRQIPAVTRELRTFSIKEIQRFLRNRHDLGRFKAYGRLQFHIHAHKLSGKRLIFCVSGILVGFSHNILCQKRLLFGCTLRVLQIPKKRLTAFSQVSGKSCQCVPVLPQCRERLLPDFIAGEKILCRPGILHRDLTALWNHFYRFHNGPPK